MQIKPELLSILKYAKSNSPFYTERLKDLELNDHFTLSDFEKIQPTTKDDLSERNRDFLAVPLTKVAEYVTTSGTSGNPVTVFLTKNDIQRLAKNEQLALQNTGANAADVFQLMTTIDRQFMAGLAYYLGVQKIGAGIVRIGPGVPALQWKSIFENEVTVLIAVPSFIISLIDYAKKHNINYKTSLVKKIICIGEPIREQNFELNILGRRICDDWNVELYSTYASTEMGAAFTECEFMQGGHLNDELLYLEVLKDDDQQASDGELGEVVITSLGVEGTPLIRYRTGDLAVLHSSPCSCGRSSVRLGPIIGRKNQMIKFKGTTIFPNAIYEVFDNFKEISCYKVEVSKDYLGNDVITVLLEKEIENSSVFNAIIEACQSKIKVVPHFVFLELEYLRSQVFKKNNRKPEKILFK